MGVVRAPAAPPESDGTATVDKAAPAGRKGNGSSGKPAPAEPKA
jgi:hypothetical protein